MDSVPVKRAMLVSPRSRTIGSGILSRFQTLGLKWREPLLIFLASRFVLLLLPFIAALLREPSKRIGNSPYIISNYYTGTLDFWTDRFLAVWGRWDGEWYLQVAIHGYTPPDSAPAFFPVYPLLMRLISPFLLGNYLLAGVLISLAASSIAFVLFYNLTWRDFKDKGLAFNTVLYLAIFPTAFYLAAIYTEALFLAIILGAFYCARHLNYRHKWWLVGILAALATLTRNVGILVLSALLWEWWAQRHQNGAYFRFKPGSWRDLAGLVLPSLASLTTWLLATWYVFGDPLLCVRAQSSWHWERRIVTPWGTVWQAFTDLISPATFSEANLINFLYFLGWLVLMGWGTWLAWRKRYPVSYLIFLGLAFLPGLSAPRTDQALFALPRYFLVLFPAYQLIALGLPRWRWLRVGYILVSLGAIGYLTCQFVQWGWVA